MSNTKDYQMIWIEIYSCAHNILFGLEGGQEILNEIIQLEVKNLKEPYDRKISRLKVLLYDYDAKYIGTGNYMTTAIQDLLNKIDLIERSEGRNEAMVEEVNAKEERKYKQLWESYKLNSRFVSSSASAVFSEFEQYSSYKVRCKKLEEFLSLVSEIVSSVSAYDLTLTRLAITKLWNYEASSNADIFDFLLRLSIAIEDKKTNNVQHISKSEAFNILDNTTGKIEVLQDIVRIINYNFHFSRDDHDYSWEEMKFYMYNMMNLKEFWNNISTLSMARWNAVAIQLHQSIC